MRDHHPGLPMVVPVEIVLIAIRGSGVVRIHGQLSCRLGHDYNIGLAAPQIEHRFDRLPRRVQDRCHQAEPLRVVPLQAREKIHQTASGLALRGNVEPILVVPELACRHADPVTLARPDR